MPFSPRFTITDAVTADLTTIERARGFLEAATLSEDWIRTVAARAFLLEAHHTTHIEGTALTLDQSEQILAGEDVTGTDPDDRQEVLNFREAFDFVSGYLGQRAAIDEALVREIHRLLVKGVRGGSARAGEYREIQNYVVNASTGEKIYTPPAAVEVPLFMSELVDWLNTPGEMHPIIQGGIAQFQLVHIHPFLDGNGRASRLLSTLCLYRSGYDFKRLFTISEYYDRNRPAFYAALQAVRRNNMDLTPWIEYFVMGLAVQLTEVMEHGKKVIKKDILIREHGLNDRQGAALGFLFGNGKLTIGDYENLSRDASRRTLQRDLEGLVGKGILKVSGSTNKRFYTLRKSRLVTDL